MCQTVPQGISEDLHPHGSPAAEADGPGPAPRVGRLVQVRAELPSRCEVFLHHGMAFLNPFSFRLLLLEGGPGSPSCLLGGKHSVSWGFEDMLPTPDNSAGGAESKGTNAFC